jgi:hypothetical protein
MQAGRPTGRLASLHDMLPVADGGADWLRPISQSHQSSDRPLAGQPIPSPSAGRLAEGQPACVLVLSCIRSLCILIADLLLSHIRDVAWPRICYQYA